METFSTGDQISRKDTRWTFILKPGSKFKLDLNVKGCFKPRLATSKWTRHGQTSLYVPGHYPLLGITVFLDFSTPPPPLPSLYSQTKYPPNTYSNLQSIRRPTTSNLQTVIQALPWYLVPGAIAAQVLSVKFFSIIQTASLTDRQLDSFLMKITLREKCQKTAFCFVSKK